MKIVKLTYCPEFSHAVDQVSVEFSQELKVMVLNIRTLFSGIENRVFVFFKVKKRRKNREQESSHFSHAGQKGKCLSNSCGLSVHTPCHK